MKLWTLSLAILVVGALMGIARDEVGRVGVIVFLTGLAASAAGLGAILALFQTAGALGEARTIGEHVEALAATALVLVVGSALMLGVLFVGGRLILWAVP